MKNKKLISKLGYSDGSPFKDEPHLDIHTPNGKIDMSNTGIPLWANGRILPPYSGIHQFDEDVVREIPLAQDGGSRKAPSRKGVRLNYDEEGNVIGESSHIMKTETLDGLHWFSFPTLFQNEDGSWLDMSEESDKDWKPAMLEAKKRGELIHFGADKEEALAFGEGSWKDLEYEELELTDEEIKQYKKGGYVVEELPSYQTYGEVQQRLKLEEELNTFGDSLGLVDNQAILNQQYLSQFPDPIEESYNTDFNFLKAFKENAEKAKNNPYKTFIEPFTKRLIPDERNEEVRYIDASDPSSEWNKKNENHGNTTLEQLQLNINRDSNDTDMINILNPGKFKKNSDVNVLNTDNTPHLNLDKSEQINDKLSIRNRTPVIMQPEITNIFGQQHRPKTVVSLPPVTSLMHEDIEPVGWSTFNAGIPKANFLHNKTYDPKTNARLNGKFRPMGQRVDYDPNSYLGGYNDENLYNFQLPKYKMPTQFTREEYYKLKEEVQKKRIEQIRKAEFRDDKKTQSKKVTSKKTENIIEEEPIIEVKKTEEPITKKEVIKEPEIPEGYALSKGYQRDGVSYGDMWHDIESTRPAISAGPTMDDYYIKYSKNSNIAIDDDLQSGGTVSQLWKQATGTPWSEAKKQGLTNGSYANNIALRKRIISGEFNSVPSQTSSRYIKEDFDYEKYGENIKRLLEEGNTLDDLVRKRIGTRAGLTNMFPELFDMPQMPEIPEQTFEPLTQNLPKQVVEEEDVEVSNNPTVNVPDWISNPAYTPPLTSNTQVEETQEEPAEIPSWINQSPFQVNPNYVLPENEEIQEQPVQIPSWINQNPIQIDPNYILPESKSVEEEPAEIPSWISQSPVQIDPDYAFPDKNKKQDGLKSFLSEFENDEEVLDNEQRQSLYLSVDQEKDKQKKAELIQQKEKEYLEQLKIEEQQRIDDYKNEMLIQYGKDKISDLKQVGENVYEKVTSTINEIKNNTQEKSNKISYYIKKAPWDKGYKKVTDYFEIITDSFLRSEGFINSDAKEATIDERLNTAFAENIDIKTDPNVEALFNLNQVPFKDLYAKEEIEQIKTIKEVADAYKPISNINNYINKNLGFDNTKYSNFKLGKVFSDNGGSSTHIIDMSDGIHVTYQPRNENSNNRTNVNNAVTVSDYLYDQDFTDGYLHVHAYNGINRLRRNIGKKDSDGQKFVTIREKVKDNEYIVKVIPFSQVTAADLGESTPLPPVYDSSKKKDGSLVYPDGRVDFINKENIVYRQGYAKLSDLDISSDGNKIKLHKSTNMFKEQGVPYSKDQSGSNENVLRVPGGKYNYGKYQNIDNLTKFHAYFGGTVTIISDDGKIVKKVTGSVKDVIRTAQEIKKQTDGKEVHFLQSDAGSMNLKASADNNNIISKDRLDIQRNHDSWAGASEILLNKKLGGEINQFELGGQYMDLDLTEEEIKEYKKGGFVIEDLPKAQNLGQVPELAPSYEFPYEYLEENTGDPEERLQFYGVNDPAKGAYPGAFDFRKDLIKYSDFSQPIGTSNAEGFEESDFRNNRLKNRIKRNRQVKGFRKSLEKYWKNHDANWKPANELFGPEGHYSDRIPLNYGGELPAHQAPPGQVSSYGLHDPIDATNDWQVKREADGIDPEVQKRIDDYYYSIPRVVKDMNKQTAGMAEFTGIPSALRVIDHPKQIAKDVINTVVDIGALLKNEINPFDFNSADKNILGNPYGSGIEGTGDAMVVAPFLKGVKPILKGTKNLIKNVISKPLTTSPTNALTNNVKTTLNKTLKQPANSTQITDDLVVPQETSSESFFYGNNAYNQNLDEQLAIANKSISTDNLALKKLKNHKNKGIRDQYKDKQYQELVTSFEPLENVDEHIKPLIERLNNPAAREKLINLGIEDPDDFMGFLHNEVQYTNIPGKGGYVGESKGNIDKVNTLLNLGIGKHNKTFSHVPNITSNTGDHEIGHLMQTYMQKRGLTKKGSATEFDKIASKFFRENKKTDDFLSTNQQEKYHYTQRDYGPNRENLLLPEDRYDVEFSNLNDDLTGAKRNLDTSWDNDLLNDDLAKDLNDHLDEATRNLDNFKKRFPNQDAHIDKTTKQLEPLAMLRELRNELYQSGAIKNFQDPIDEKTLMNFWKSDNGKQNRILSFLQPSKKGRSGIINLINKTPIVAGAIGTGTVLSQKKNGGEIEYLDLDLTEDQIKNYQKGGFVVEDLPTHQTPPGEVKEFLNSVSNSYPEKGNPAIDMLDLDVFGTLNEFFVEPAKRVIQDPIGTVKSIGNTAADVASFFNPLSVGSAEPLIESMVGEDINFGGDGNNAFGTPYWTDNALALDAAVIAPALRVIGKGASSTFKALTKMPNKTFKMINESGENIHNITKTDVLDIAKRIKQRLLTPKFIKNNMASTKRTEKEVIESVNNFIDEFQNGSITFANKGTDANYGGIYHGNGKIVINTDSYTNMNKNDMLGTIEHELHHLFSDSKGLNMTFGNEFKVGNKLYDNYPTFKLNNSADIPGGITYQSIQPEQQVRFRKAIDWLEKNADLKMGEDITEEMVEKLAKGLKEGETRFAEKNINGKWTAPPQEGGVFSHQYKKGDYIEGIKGGSDLRASTESRGYHEDIDALFSNIDNQSIPTPEGFAPPGTTKVGSKRWIKHVTEILNNAYAIPAAIGTGAVLSQEEDGGEIGYKSKKEIEDLINQGYGIEYLD